MSYRDILSIGGISTFQAIESAVNYTDEFGAIGTSGIVGVALSSNNTVKPVKQNTFFANIVDGLALPVMTANLYLEAESSFNFVYINESLIDERITWARVNTSDSQAGWWSIPVDGYSIGSGEFVEDSFLTILDTGTFGILLPSSIVSTYYAQVEGSFLSLFWKHISFPAMQPFPTWM